jgi:hypothetical protein
MLACCMSALGNQAAPDTAEEPPVFAPFDLDHNEPASYKFGVARQHDFCP